MDSFAQSVAKGQAYLFNESENFHHGNDWPPNARSRGKNRGKGTSSYDYSLKGECREGTNGAAKGKAYNECEHFKGVDSNHEMQKMRNLARILAREAAGESGTCSYAWPPANFNENGNFNYVNDRLPKAKGIGKNKGEGKSSYAYSVKGACREGLNSAAKDQAHHFNEGENFYHGIGWLPNAKGTGKNAGDGASSYTYLVKGACSKGKDKSGAYSYAHPTGKGQAHHFNRGDDFNHVNGWLPKGKGFGKNRGEGKSFNANLMKGTCRKGADQSGTSSCAQAAAIGQAYYFNECENFDRDNLSASIAVSSPSCVTVVHEEEMHRHCEISNAHSGAIVAIAMQEQGIYTASKDKTLKRWKPEKDTTGRFHLREDLKVVLEEACFSLCCVGGFIFCGLWDGSVKAFSQDGFNCQLCGHSKRVMAIIQHQSILITGSVDRDVRLWQMDPDTKIFGCSHTLENCMQGAICCLYVFGENLWIGGTRGIAMCNLGSLKVTKLLLPMSSVAKFLEVQGHIVAAYADGTIRVFDGDGNQKSEMPALAAGPIVSIGGLEAGPRLLCGHLDGQVSTIVLPNFVFKTQFQAFKDTSADSLFCPGQDGLFLIGSKSGSLQLWQKIGSLDEVATSPEARASRAPVLQKIESLDEVITSAETIESSAPVKEETMCIVCLEMPSNVALTPCGHALMCMECAITMFEPGGNAGYVGMHICTTKKSCPTCRRRVASFLRIYK